MTDTRSQDAGMSEDELRALLESSTTIAVVGASTHERKAANRIPRWLMKAGFTIIPVNPSADEILGQKAYRTLADIPVPVDIVDVFRPAEEAAGVAEQAAAIGAKTLWLQLEIRSEEARAIAEAAGMNFIEDNCLGVTVNELGITK
ncbi:MAG: CoA-binding protein [Cryobacterium sp.]|nr:CoA-binding protein [Cryobacterium sp.]MBX3309260.1 CoA-binding protein [Cryobacterium sp.]